MAALAASPLRRLPTAYRQVLLVLCHVSYHALRAPRHLPDYRSREQLAERLLLALEHIHDGFHKD